MGDWYTIGILVGLGAVDRGRRDRRAPARARGARRRGRRGGRDRARLRPVGRGGRRRGRRGLRRHRLGAARRAARCAAAAHAAARRCCSRSPRSSARRSRSSPCSGTSRPSPCRRSAHACARARRSATPGSDRLPRTDASQAKPKPVVLVVVDGLTPSMFEAADTPALRFLAEHGEYRRAVVDVPVADARLPQLDRDRHASRRPPHPAPRLVASRRAAARRVRLVVRRGPRRRAHALAARHDRRPEREAPLARRRDRLRDARGRRPDDGRDQHHVLPRPHRATCATIPGAPAVYGPKRFFWYSLYESDRTGAPIAVRNRALGSIDAYAAWVGRWLVTRDGFDLLVYYLPDYDYASHAAGPGQLAGGARALATPRSARCSTPPAGRTRSSSGTPSSCAPTTASRRSTASRASTPATTSSPRRTARRWSTPTSRVGSPSVSTTQPSAGIVCFREDDRVVARRDGDEDDAILDAVPDGRVRAAAALANPNAGEVLVSAAPGWEFSTSPAATTSAAAATARSSPPTRRCRCSRSGSDRRPRRSPASRMRSCATSQIPGA